MMSDISKSKDNQTMKFGQLIECNVVIFFFKNHAENEARRLVPDLFLFLKRGLYEVKSCDQHINFNIILD